MTDIYMNPATHDLDIVDGLLRLTSSRQELVRQKVDITLNTFQGEWPFNTIFGVPYLQEILRKGPKAVADLALINTITNVDGVVRLVEFESTVDKQTRKYTVTFSCEIDSGEIISVEVEI